MNRLLEQVTHTLSSQGVLAQHWPGFKPRPGQTDMAVAVTETLAQGGALVVEAGTGVGKTFAYLVPVLLSGQRALISTATKALQDQLFARDLPRLTQVLNLPVRIALLKGRSSYLCLHRMAQARQQPQANQAVWQQTLSRVEQWAQATRTGDLAELPGFDEASGLWPQVTSTRDNCLGSTCPRYKACHVNLARKEAMAADVVVINHHLFFADLAVRESGVAELLPTVRVTVFDEAHQLNEIGVHFLGQELSTLQLLELARDVLAAGLSLARGLVDWHCLSEQLERAARDWRLVAGQHRGSTRLRWQTDAPQGMDAAAWAAGLVQVQQALQALSQGLGQVSELAPDFQRLLERSEALCDMAQCFQRPGADDVVRWAEVSAALRVVQAPLDVADTFARLTAPAALPAGEHQDPSPTQAPTAPAWIFTSATLGDDPGLSWFTGPCGLSAARTLRVDSPFDYAEQAALYVPEEVSAPSERQHPLEVARLVLDAARRIGGRTLVLTTTLSAMRTIGEFLQSHMAEDRAPDACGAGGVGRANRPTVADAPPTMPKPDRPLEVLVQGQSPKRLLMSRFRQGGAPGRAGCILVASASFWEGFDVPGDALQLVVIDKLPFAPPEDPIYEARGQRLQRLGRNVFIDQALPEAAVSLKQGAGRLIRSETDRGILMVCDQRLVRKGYGLRLLKALPPMRRIDNRQDFEQALAHLQAASPELPPGL